MADWKTVRHDPSYVEPLDPELIPLLDALNAAGFVTTSSCCGHGYGWPHIWFEHGNETRIESLARFILRREQGDYRNFFTCFWKEVRLDGYAWMIEIHLNNVFRTTSIADGLAEAVRALASVTRAVIDWTSAKQ